MASASIPVVKIGIPSDLQHFIAEHIDSVHTLEVLLHVHRLRERTWSAEEVVLAVKSSVSAVRRSLAALTEAGLLAPVPEEPGSFQYRPRTAKLARTVDDLASHYSQRSTAVISQIYRRSTERH